MARAISPPVPRPARPDDRPAVEAVVAAAYAHHAARIGRPPGPMLDDYGALIAAGRVWVADLDSGPAGILVLIPETGALLLDNVAVRPDAQGTGVGRALLSFAEDMARRSGLAVIRLYTNEAMVENIALYGRLGYRETHRAVERGYRRVYMAKDLAGAD